MPRNIDPGLINVGTGLAADESIETNAFVNPTGGNEGLRVHIVDPSRAHDARAIYLLDAAGNFVSDHVEGALEEIVGATSAARNSGLLEGGTFAASSGLTFELDSPTQVVIDGSVGVYGGEQVALTPSTTQYVYIDTTTNLLTASVGLPALTTEPILLAEVTTDGTGIVSSRDLRFFVFNLDRKNSLIVRSDGASFNQRSEANFITLEAALTYLELYAGSGSTEVETHHIIVRGVHTISSPITLPISDILFEGDGTGVFATGASLAGMFNLGGQSNIQFRNLEFECSFSASTAIASSDPVTGLVVEHCAFTTTGTTWGGLVSLASSVSPNQDIIVRDCVAFESIDGNGIVVNRPDNVLVSNCRLRCSTSTSGTPGVVLGFTAATPGEGRSAVRDCVLDGFSIGIITNGDSITVDNCTVLDSRTGITHETGNLFTVKDSSIVLSADDSGTTGADIGLALETGLNHVVSGVRMVNARVAWTAGGDPSGIALGNGGAVERVSIDNCTILNFLNTTTGGGSGIVDVGGSTTTVKITSTHIETAGTGIDLISSGGVNNAIIDGCTLVGVGPGISGVGGLSVNGVNVKVSDTRVALDGTRGVDGMIVVGARSKVRGCTVTLSRGAWTTELPRGIVLTGADQEVSGCYFEGFFNTSNNTGYGIDVQAASDRSLISGCSIVEGQWGIFHRAAANLLRVSDCHIREVLGGVSSSDTIQMTNTYIQLEDTAGLVGIDSSGDNSKFTGINILNPRNNASSAWFATEETVGMWLQGANTKVTDCHLDGWNNTTDGTGIGIQIDANNVAIRGTSFEDSVVGVANFNANTVPTVSSISRLTVDDCVFASPTIASVYLIGLGVTVENVKIQGCTATGGNIGVFASDVTGLTVSGNSFDGLLGSSGTGIRVSGGGNPTGTSRFNISDNTLTGFTSVGISLINLISSGSVSGNVIDNHLGASVQVTGVGINVDATTGQAPRDIDISGNTVYNATYGVGATGDAADPVLGLSIVGNTFHHIARDVSPTDTISGAGGCGVLLSFAEDCVVSNNSISEIGAWVNPDGTTFTPTGPNYSSQGIYQLNCERVVCNSNDVRGVVPGGTGVGRGIAIRQRNNAASTTLEGFTVVGNVVDDRTSTMDELILIESDDDDVVGTQTLRNTVVEGNTLRNGVDGIVLRLGLDATVMSTRISGNTGEGFSNHGVHVHLAFDSSNLLDTHITDNNFRDVGGTAFYTNVEGNTNSLLSFHVNDNTASSVDQFVEIVTLGTISDITFRRMSVNGNTFNGSTTRGIRIRTPSGIGTGSIFSQIAVDDNTINNSQDAIFLNLDNNTATYTDLSVSGNSIYDVSDEGIRFGVGGVNSGIRIDGNTVIDYVTSGIRFDANVSPPYNVSMSNNKLDTSVGVSSHLRFAQSDTPGENISICGNQLGSIAPLPGTSPGIEVQGFLSSLTEAGVTDLQVNNNNIIMSNQEGIRVYTEGILSRAQVNGNNIYQDDVNAPCILIRVEPDTPTVIYNENIQVNGNICQVGTHGIELRLLQKRLRNIQVNGNIISEGDDSAILWRVEDVNTGTNPGLMNVSVDGNTIINCRDGIELDWGYTDVTTQTTGFENISVSNNKISDFFATNGNGIFYGCSATTKNLKICDNQLTNLDLATTVNSNVIAVDMVTAGIESCVISDNLIEQCGGNAISVQRSLGTPTLEDLVVRNNTINFQGQGGIYIEGDVFSSVDRVDITGNHIRDFGSGATVANDVGIFLITPAGADATFINISGNSLIDGEGYAIQCDFNEDVYNLKVNDNHVDGTNSGGTGDNGIQIRGDSLIMLATVCNNNVLNVRGDGIELHSQGIDSGSGMRNFNVSHNNVRDEAGVGTVDGIYVYGSGSTNDTNLLTGTVNGNTISAVANVGLTVSTGDSNYSSNMNGVTVSGNTVANADGVSSQDGGIIVSAAGQMRAVTVNGNTVRNTENNGIYMAAADSIYGVSINDNTVEDWSNNANTDYYGGIYVANPYPTTFTANCFGLNITGNSFRNQNTYASGIYLDGFDQLSECVVVNSNVMTMNGASNTRGVTWNQGPNGTDNQRVLTFVGNAVQGADSAANTTGSTADFTPINSTVSANASDGIGSVFTWINWFGTYFTSPTNTSNGDNAD